MKYLWLICKRFLWISTLLIEMWMPILQVSLMPVRVLSSNLSVRIHCLNSFLPHLWSPALPKLVPIALELINDREDSTPAPLKSAGLFQIDKSKRGAKNTMEVSPPQASRVSIAMTPLGKLTSSLKARVQLSELTGSKNQHFNMYKKQPLTCTAQVESEFTKARVISDGTHISYPRYCLKESVSAYHEPNLDVIPYDNCKSPKVRCLIGWAEMYLINAAL